MRIKRTDTVLAWLIFVLMVTAMVATSFTVIGFVRKAHEKQIQIQASLLHHVVSEKLSAYISPNGLLNRTGRFFFRQELERSGFVMGLLESADGNMRIHLGDNALLLNIMERDARKRLARGHSDKSVVFSKFKPPGLFKSTYLMAYMAVFQDKETWGYLSVAKPINIFSAPFSNVMVVLACYILTTAGILSLVGYYLIYGHSIRPLQKLRFQIRDIAVDEQFWFAEKTDDSEVGKLSGSLKSLFTRVGADRKSLKDTIQTLEASNAEIKKMQSEIIQAEKMASIGRLSAGLAHEIGNPIGIVQGYLDLMARNNEDSDINEYITRSSSEISRIDGIIQQLLNYARPASPAVHDHFPLHPALTETIDTIKPNISGVAWEADFAAERDVCTGHADQIKQVFINLLLNAVDAIKDAGETNGRIHVNTRNERRGTDDISLVIEIIDNGIGIDEDNAVKIFDPFYTSKPPGQGTGLGLSVSLTIIEAMGGSLKFIRSADRHTCAQIILPVIPEPEEMPV